MAKYPIPEEAASFTGDGAYGAQDVHEACHGRSAIPIPIIQPRKGVRPRKGLAFTHRNEAVKACKRVGRSIWKRCSGLLRYSLVPTKMNCFKRLGEKAMARTFERQVVELNIRASILNRLTELCMLQTVGPLHNWVWGWGKHRLKWSYATKPSDTVLALATRRF